MSFKQSFIDFFKNKLIIFLVILPIVVGIPLISGLFYQQQYIDDLNKVSQQWTNIYYQSQRTNSVLIVLMILIAAIITFKQETLWKTGKPYELFLRGELNFRNFFWGNIGSSVVLLSFTAIVTGLAMTFFSISSISSMIFAIPLIAYLRLPILGILVGFLGIIFYSLVLALLASLVHLQVQKYSVAKRRIIYGIIWSLYFVILFGIQIVLKGWFLDSSIFLIGLLISIITFILDIIIIFVTKSRLKRYFDEDVKNSAEKEI